MHELPTGQSLASLQPHAVPMHSWPFALAVQSVHVPPTGPHAVVVPPPQVPPLQHDPLHACDAEHETVH